MRIISLQIENVLGVKEFKLDAGQITEISGRNEEGKTSILEALQNAIGGGSLKKIKNTKTDEPARIVLALRDEDGINYVLDKTEAALYLKKQVGDTAGFEDVGKPQTFLNTLRDCKLMNPISFLDCDDKERINLILQAIDLPFSREELWDAVGYPEEDFDRYPAKMNPLAEISKVRELVFNRRSGVNVSKKEKRNTVEQNRRQVPLEIPTVEGIAALEKELSETKLKAKELKEDATRQREFFVSRVESDLESLETQCANELSSFIDSEEKQLEVEVERLRSAMRDRVEFRRSELSLKMKEAEKEKDVTIKKADAKYHLDMEAIEELAPEIERLAGELSEKREQEKNIIRIQTIHDLANKMEEEANSLDELSKGLGLALKRIDKYKESITKDLPIPGLDISGNTVFINGVPWSQLNKAQKITSAVKIIAARAKNYPFKFVVVDDAEHLDEKSRKILSDTLLSHDIQSVVARVAETDLEIKK